MHACASMCTGVELMERRQRCVTAAPSDSLQVKDGHQQDGEGVRSVSMVSSGILEGTDWKLDLHKLRLTLSAVLHATITCVVSDRWIDSRGELPVQVDWLFYLSLEGIRQDSGWVGVGAIY